MASVVITASRCSWGEQVNSHSTCTCKYYAGLSVVSNIHVLVKIASYQGSHVHTTNSGPEEAVLRRGSLPSGLRDMPPQSVLGHICAPSLSMFCAL